MSDKRTPKTGTVRTGFIKGHPFPLTTEVEDREAEFDRWLVKVQADAWDTGWDAGNDYALVTPTHYQTLRSANPYRKAADE